MSARFERWMQRALVLGLLVLLTNLAIAPAVVPVSAPADGASRGADEAAAAQVSWPASTGLLVSEVVTRGVAAADQYVELYNASAAPLDLAGLELAYVTASGLTVTRKQTWTSLLVPAYSHLLIANAAGIYAAAADGLFSNGGFSTAGGTLALRVVSGGQVIDALSWGSAASTFVEGSVGTAPPTGSSLERKPGGLLGNATDTNDNLADTRLEPGPVAQNLAAAPVPAATPSPTTSATAEPSPTDLPTTGPTPTHEPSPTLDPWPTEEPTAVPTDTPTAEPSPTPTPLATLEPSPPPTASPSPLPLTVGEARLAALGSTVTVYGLLTTPVGLTESGRGAFIEDAGAGIALYLATGEWPAIDPGTDLVVSGTLETRYSLLTIRLATAADAYAVGAGLLPSPIAAFTGLVDEVLEGRLATIEGAVTDGISTLSDGFSTAVDDGSGPLRVIVANVTGIAPDLLASGSTVRLTGVVGQRDTSGTGLSGYRLHLRSTTDVTVIAAPTAEPTASPSPDPTASPSPLPTTTPVATPSATPTPTPTPTPMPSPSAAPITIATARSMPIGAAVMVSGTVTAESGRVLDDGVIVIQDSSGGICVRLPADSTQPIPTGAVVTVTGILAAPYGNLELRPSAATDVSVNGTAAVPTPAPLQAVQLGESSEGLLASIAGSIVRIESTTTSLTLFVEDSSGEARVFASSAVGVSRTDFVLGSQLRVTGVVGDRLGLYRLWPRDRADFVLLAPPSPSPSPSPGPNPTPTPRPTSSPLPTPTGQPAPEVLPIAATLNRVGQIIAIQGVVTAPAGLLDSDGRRVTIQDSSAAVLVRLPEGSATRVGQRLLVIGEVGTYYGAPQLAATDAPVNLPAGATLTPTVVRAARLPSDLEWQLAKVSGTVSSVSRDGDAWHAEISIAGGSLPIDGLARSGIASTALVVGRTATVTGIVKRPYPTASDQRYSIVPRTAADISLGGAASQPSGSAGPLTSSGTTPISGPGAVGSSPASPAGSAGGAAARRPANMALADIAAHEGEVVLVGGAVEAVDADRLLISDGSGVAAVRLPAGFASASVRVGSLLNARGTVSRNPQGGLEVVVNDVDGIRLLDVILTAAERDIGDGTSLADPAITSGLDAAIPMPLSAPPPVTLVLVFLLALATGLGTLTLLLVRRPQLLIAAKLALARRRPPR